VRWTQRIVGGVFCALSVGAGVLDVQALSRRAYRERLAALEEELRQPRPEPRRAAVRGLVELGGEEA
jgi:hypothetical protein